MSEFPSRHDIEVRANRAGFVAGKVHSEMKLHEAYDELEDAQEALEQLREQYEKLAKAAGNLLRQYDQSNLTGIAWRTPGIGWLTPFMGDLRAALAARPNEGDR